MVVDGCREEHEEETTALLQQRHERSPLSLDGAHGLMLVRTAAVPREMDTGFGGGVDQGAKRMHPG